MSRLPGGNLARGADSWGRLVGSVLVVESDLFGVFGLLVGWGWLVIRTLFKCLRGTLKKRR